MWRRAADVGLPELGHAPGPHVAPLQYRLLGDGSLVGTWVVGLDVVDRGRLVGTWVDGLDVVDAAPLVGTWVVGASVVDGALVVSDE